MPGEVKARRWQGIRAQRYAVRPRPPTERDPPARSPHWSPSTFPPGSLPRWITDTHLLVLAYLRRHPGDVLAVAVATGLAVDTVEGACADLEAVGLVS